MFETAQYFNFDALPDFKDFEITSGWKKKVYYDHLGNPCELMNYLSESDWITPESSYSEFSSEESSEPEEVSPSPKKSTTESPSRSKLKKEISSDGGSTERENRKKAKRSKNKKEWRGVEYSNSESSDEEQVSTPKPPISTRQIKEEPEYERKFMAGVVAAFGEYHCEICKITVNSEQTLQTHMLGKKHQKELKARAIPEVAKQSVRIKQSGKKLPSPPPTAAPLRQNRRILRNERSLIQDLADDYREGPVPGLSSVIEIRTPHMKDYSYYCTICDAPCVSNSIMVHLTGFKHYLKSLEKIDPDAYRKYEYCHKHQAESKVKRIIVDYERRYGRGRIQVEEVVEEPAPRRLTPRMDDRNEAGPSWRDDSMPFVGFIDLGDEMKDLTVTEDLDMSLNVFYCTMCDAHMNNQSMWESHIRGKRHLKNKKKTPGENVSKVKSALDPHATPHLLRLLEDVSEPIVGLDYIKETQGEQGDMYNCFLCGACTSAYDIIDHLLTMKHRLKLLETEQKKGKESAINYILGLHDISTTSKETLVQTECFNFVQKYGEGNVKVYKSKDIVPQYGSRR